jgi:hypothetical protein
MNELPVAQGGGEAPLNMTFFRVKQSGGPLPY